MKKILILGAGPAQKDFIKACKRAGLETHVCSNNPKDPGAHFADVYSEINITDKSAVSNYVGDHLIDRVYSVGSDIAMPVVSFVCQAHRIPVFVKASVAALCNYKIALRDTLDNIPYVALFREDDCVGWKTFPAIVKPSRSQGQRGVTKVHNKTELVAAYHVAREHSPSAIVEKFIDGFEISVNTYVIKGRPSVVWYVTKRVTEEGYTGIIKKHVYPVGERYDEDALKAVVGDCIEKLNISRGPVYFQIIIDKEGKPHIIEVSPRLDGCHIWRMICMTKGIDLMSVIINDLFYGTPMCERSFIEASDAELSFFNSKPGKRFSRKDYQDDICSIFIEWYYRDGDIIPVKNGLIEKVGYQIVPR